VTGPEISRLPLRVPYRVGEPGHGLLARLGARHQETDIRAFAAKCGLSFDRVALGHNLDQLAVVAGLSLESLRQASPAINAGARVVRLGKDLVRLTDWSPRRRRWCPMCLNDDVNWALNSGRRIETAAFHRFWWDLKSIGSCPLHRSLLQDRCIACGSMVEWSGRPLHLCACGSSLAASVPHEIRVADPDDLYLVARLTGSDHPPVPLLDAISLKDVISGVERLGLAVSRSWSGIKPVVTEAEAKAARAEGMRVALAWEAPFVGALDRLVREARGREAPKGMIGTYGWIYEHWASILPGDTFGVEVKTALREHAVANGVVAEGEPLLGKQSGLGAVNITGAARALGQSYERTRRTLDKAGLLPIGARQGVAVPVDSKWVARTKAAQERTINLKGLQNLLGIGKAQTRRIVEGGLVPAGPAGSDELCSGRFLLSDAHDFVARVRKKTPQRNSIPVRAALLPSACRSVGIRIEVAVRLILEGNVSPVGVLAGSVGISGVLVHPADLRRTAGKALALTVEGAARELGVHSDVARFLVRRRYLPVRSDGARRSIDRASLQQFHAKHMSGVEVARILGASPRHIARKLAAVGVKPVIGPPECRQLFFDRQLAQDGLAYLRR